MVPSDWSKPTEVFNVRLPAEQNELLDDLIYKRKKAGLPHSKVQLGIEAVTLLLREEGLVSA